MFSCSATPADAVTTGHKNSLNYAMYSGKLRRVFAGVMVAVSGQRERSEGKEKNDYGSDSD